MEKKTIQIFNSSKEGAYQANLDLKHLLRYLKDEHKQRHNGASLPDVDKWKLIANKLSTTHRQKNGMSKVLFPIDYLL